MMNSRKRDIIKYFLFTTAAVMVCLLIYKLAWPRLVVSFKKRQLEKLDVILITLDTLRADYVGAYGKGKAETPNIDGVAADGVLFTNCIAQTPLTLPSHTSILTGTYPPYHQVRDNGGFLVPGKLQFISEILQAHDISTAAFIAAYVLHSKWGINQGFDHYADDFDLSKYRKISLGNVQKRAAAVLGDAREWLKANAGKGKRFFTWIHLYDPHTPYDPPSPFKEKYPHHPYRGEVEYLDQQLGFFFDFLKAEGIYDNCLLILVGDHGESLGEHKENTHGFFIYEPTVEVPLIIRAPVKFPVRQVASIVETVDIVPTILEALDIKTPAKKGVKTKEHDQRFFYQGESLLNLMLGAAGERQKNTAYSETFYPRLHFGWSELKAFYSSTENKTSRDPVIWKYILAPQPEFYRTDSDTHEQENMVLIKSADAQRAKAKLLDFIAEKSQGALEPGEVSKMDRDDLQKLAALGYLDTFVDRSTAGKTGLPDPKGKVQVFNELAGARQAMSEEKYDEAVALLEKIIAANPEIIDGILQLGVAYNGYGEYEKALDCFYRVLEKKPDYQAAMMNVVGALVNLDRLDQARQECLRFLEVFPGDFSLHNELGIVHFLQQNYEEALESFKRSIALEPVNPVAFNRMGGIYIIRGELDKARSFLEQALAINRSLRKLYFNLAQAAEGRGDMQAALGYYQKELENYPDDYKSAYNLAEILRKSNRYEEAVVYYRQSLDANPRFNIPYFMIANYYLKQQDRLEEAIDICSKGIDITPEDKYTAFGYYILADIYALQGNRSKHSLYLSRGQYLESILKQRKQW